MKFEEAFSLNEDRVLSVDDVTLIRRNSLTAFENEYKENFVCPECFQAKILYSNAATPYYRSYPKASHTDDCSLRQEEMEKKQTIAFVKDDKNKERLTRQLNNLILLI